MSQISVVFLPIGRVNFHMESANDSLQKSREMFQKIHPGVSMPNELLTSIEALSDYLKKVAKPDLIILQNTTFVDSTFAAEVLRNFDCTILLWTLREPAVDGGRLRLNSLTGAFSAGNLFYNRGKKFEYIFGSPVEEKVQAKISTVIKACQVYKNLKELTIGVVGNAPSGFYFSNALDTEVQNAVGAKLEYIEARDIIKKAKELAEAEYMEHLDKAHNNIKDLNQIPEENLHKFGRLAAAYTAFVKEKNIKALASRCWPDFFVEYQTPVCSVLSGLTEEGVVSSCEADVYGAISMFILREFTGTAPYFGDPVSLDEKKNSLIFWHCGAGACSLAHQSTGARAGVHPNRKIGPTMEFGLKPGRVTVIRLGRKPNGRFRMFLMTGEALDEPQKFLGTSVEVKADTNAAEIVDQAVVDGWEPHFALVYGDVKEEIKVLCNLLNLEVVEY
ncbi:MAG: L-fucose/L-arabinose isomerase family protein [Bacillota bacterium]